MNEDNLMRVVEQLTESASLHTESIELIVERLNLIQQKMESMNLRITYLEKHHD